MVALADKYFSEAKLAVGEPIEDRRIIRIRMLKAASLLVSGLQYLGEESDLEDIAGVSSTKFPLPGGGLKTFLGREGGE